MIRQTLFAILIALSLCQDGYAQLPFLGKHLTPDSVESYTRKCFKMKRWKAGKDMLEAGWKSYGDMSVMNELMGWYYFNFRQYDKARFYLVRALRDDYTNTNARELLADLEENTHNYSSAICYINEILENNPYSRGWWRRKINLYRKQGNNAEADRLLARLRQIYPNDPQVKQDIAGLHEQRLKKQKADGDIQGQIESLKNLLTAYPKETEYYLALSNLLLQTGRTSEAAETLVRGVRMTGSATLIRKRAGMLGEQGRYTEAINYLNEMKRLYHLSSLDATINEMELAAAESSMLNDPYTSMARVYAKQHKPEALNFLMNTAIARGYYDDALMYIKEAKGKGSGTEELQYKEYIVQKRLGNRGAALSLLTKMFAKNPRNGEVKEELCIMRYESAAEQMNMDQYSDAIPDLLFVETYATEQEMKKGAMTRLYNCYYETKQYAKAHEQLDKLLAQYNYDNYYLQLGTLLKTEGRSMEALEMLADAYSKTEDPEKAKMIAYQYEELAQPYIKGLIERGMIRAADKAVKSALLVCPTSNDLLHQAITTSDLLGKKDDYADMVHAGRRHYPGDPFFIVKEAGLKADSADYAGAVRMLRPELDTFIGDSTLVRAFSQHSISLAMDQAKAKAYDTAIATLDTALVFHHKDRELLYTKGIIYESMHNYDSAYVYQRYYKPTLMDYREHKQHLEELRGRSFNNEISIIYQQARPGSEDVISANAFVTYTMKRRRNEYSFNIAYAGRDGSSDGNLTKEEMVSGGTGIMVGVDWHHELRDKPWAFSVGAAWASKYFPQVTLKGQLERELRNGWLLNLHASLRSIQTFTRHYSWQPNPERYQPTDPEYVYLSTGWDDTYDPLIQLGLGAQRNINDFVVSGSVDAFMLKSKLYFNGQVKGQYYPLEGSRTNVYATCGLGTAPQTELLDNSMPAGFSKVNTFVGGGLMWFLNRHIAGVLSGTWYNMYRSQNVQTGIWGTEYATIRSSNNTDYKNIFYIQGQIILTF